MTRDDEVRSVRQLIKDFQKYAIPAERMEYMESYLVDGPYLALEMLCAQLEDFDIAIDAETFARIKELAASLGMPDSTWKHIVVSSAS